MLFMLVMYHRILLLAALLTCCSGESSVHGPPKTVVAFAGGDVILPCNFSITDSDDFPTVEWSKQGLRPNVVFLYRDGCETPEMKNPAFRYRTSLITKELKNGNISLRISNVQLADAGKYQCMRLWKKARRDITAVELVVGAVSEPKLSVTSAEHGGVALECEANCWLPEPEIYFLDDQGNNIPADDPKRDHDARGCYTVRRRVTLQDATNRVICRVHQPEINQTWDKETLLPVDGRKSCSLTFAIAVGGVVLLLLVLSCGLFFFLWRRCGKSAAGQKLSVTRQSSDQSTISGSSESNMLLQSVTAVRDGNTEDITVEMLTAEVANLKSKLHEQENTICQLQNDKSQLTAVVCQYNQPRILCSPAASTIRSPPKSANVPQIKRPKPGIARQNSNPVPRRPIQKSHRRHSSPALMNLPLNGSSSLEKKLGRIGCSTSDDLARPGPGTKLQRQNSSVFSLPSSANTRFTLLTDLTEESEMLIA